MPPNSTSLRRPIRSATGAQPKWVAPVLAEPFRVARAGAFVVTVTPMALLLAAGAAAISAALLAVPYLCAAAPYARVADEDSARANRGWRHFLWINYACGFVVTMLLIVFAISTA